MRGHWLLAATEYRSELDRPDRRLWAITFVVVHRFPKIRRFSSSLAVAELRSRGGYPSPTGSRPPGTGPSWPVPGHYLDAKPHPTDIKLCQRIVLVTHSNFPHIDWAHNLLEVALKPGSKPPIFRPFGPSSPPQTYGVNGHTRCRRSNQTKQTSCPAFPGPCSQL